MRILILVFLVVTVVILTGCDVLESVEHPPTQHPPDLPLVANKLPVPPPHPEFGYPDIPGDFSAQYSRVPGVGCPLAAQTSKMLYRYTGLAYYHQEAGAFHLYCVVYDQHDVRFEIRAAELWEMSPTQK